MVNLFTPASLSKERFNLFYLACFSGIGNNANNTWAFKSALQGIRYDFTRESARFGPEGNFGILSSNASTDADAKDAQVSASLQIGKGSS